MSSYYCIFFFFFGLSDRNELCCLLKNRNGSHCCFLALPLQWPDDLSPVENDRKPFYRPKMQKPQDKKEWHAQSHRAQDSEPGNPTSEPRCPSSFPGDLKPCTEHVTSPLEGELPPSMGLNEPLGRCANYSRQYQRDVAHYLLHVRPSVWAVVLNSPRCLPFPCLHARSSALCGLPLVRVIIIAALSRLSH